MDIKHFFKMLFGLILMALLGIGGLILLNNYTKNTASTSSTSQ